MDAERALSYWGKTMEGRRFGVPYSRGGCEEGDVRRRRVDPHPGMFVVLEVDGVLDVLDGKLGVRPFRSFATHRWVEGFRASQFPNGVELERAIVAQLGTHLRGLDGEALRRFQAAMEMGERADAILAAREADRARQRRRYERQHAAA